MFLLNQVKDGAYAVGDIVFTFHYVSIKSGGDEMNGIDISAFTFHYVSIKSCCKRN